MPAGIGGTADGSSGAEGFPAGLSAPCGCRGSWEASRLLSGLVACLEASRA